MSVTDKVMKTVAAAGGVATYLYLQNTWIQETEYDLVVPNLARENDGLKIAHLSDLHMPNTKINLDQLVKAVKEAAPDLVFLTGDQVDAGNAFHLEESVSFLSKLRHIAPTYAVNGNHDINSPNKSDLVALYRRSGITFLENDAYSLLLPGRKALVVMGLAEAGRLMKSQTRQPLRNIALRPDWAGQTRLLLAHHPEDFEKFHTDPTIAPDVTFSGHAHGGQIRIPGIGGLFAPGQGRMPAHTSGVFAYRNDHSKKLVISRGLGPSQFPFRINNRPELVLVTLHHSSAE
ncbi:metallophosphoesterase [Jeotgalibaca caeni]|uniref:metallophosphoesterase n=1 Tax=Jeotgalibaca caeni TaxID=3028623 RepID=UPI00237E8688|nr:metallophosphoesterase [Jeotgalibaca caeni]MDE1548229.1 metallophosphoesterase [Jeotgalibaca caeni]